MTIEKNSDWKLTESGFELSTPQLNRPWYNYVSNPEYGLKISHLGDAYSTTLEQPRIAVSNYDFFHPSKGRFVFVRDRATNETWSPSWWPCKTPLDFWVCRHEPGATGWTGEKRGVRVSQTVFVPRNGTAEAWLVTVENASAETREVDIVPEMEFLLYNSFSVDPVYYSWYSDTRVDADGTILFERRIGSPITGFFAPLAKPDSFETSLRRFLGNGDIADPEAVQKGALSSAMSGGDAYIGAFRYTLALKPGERHTFGFIAGVGSETHETMRKRFGHSGDLETELTAIRAEWKAKLDRPFLAPIPEGEYKTWLKTFFGYQLYQQSLGMVRGTYRGFRDVAQDIMGICRYDASAARALLVDLGSRMLPSGQALRQWNTEGGANDERDFRDLPFWLILALDTYVRATGDATVYEEKTGWSKPNAPPAGGASSVGGTAESSPNVASSIPAPASLWDHAVTGIRYALQYGNHGLVKMGAGDWNDALSGPGAEGGTTFLNQIAYYALTVLDRVSKAHGFAHPFNVAQEQNRLYDGLVKYWNGKWFARAVTESGEIVGDETDTGGMPAGSDSGRIFLLPQVWFTISGMDSHDGGKTGPNSSASIAKTALDTALARLERPEGLIKCDPGYSLFDPKAGNLSALTPGMAENFAVYNHAAAFAVYAFHKAGRTADAERIKTKIFPFVKDWKKTKAEPYVLVNFYNGGYYPEKAGEGGVPWLTGTVNWLSLCLFDFELNK